MDFEINELLKKLKAKKIIFESEAQFQFELALQIKEMYPYYDVKLEMTTSIRNDGKKQYTDIIVLDKNGDFIAIELKYKTRKSVYGDIKLLNHGATDLGRFDYLYDVWRLENLKYRNNTAYEFNKRLKNCVNGYAIILTNEKNYWSINRQSKDALYKNFCITDKDSIQKNENLSWNQKDGSSCIKGTWRDIQLLFTNGYNFKWNDYIFDFKYLITNI